MRHVLLFDLDQTFLDFHATERKALGIVLRAHGLPFSDAVYREFKAVNKALWLELEKGTVTREALFARRFEHVLRLCGGDGRGPDPLRINGEFILTMSQNGIVMDGALEFLDRVKRGIPGVSLYIASNGVTVNALGRVASTGLDRYLDGVFISEELGAAKPDRRFFDIILERIGVPRERCLMIGDSLTSDMLGAKNAGIRSVWFMPAGDVEKAVEEYDVTWTAADYDELYDVIRAWAGE